MALQKINWTQIDTLNIPSGYTVNLGSISTPLDGVITDNLIIQGINFFAWLSGTSGDTIHYAILEQPNEFLENQTIFGNLYLFSPTGETGVNLILSGSVDSSIVVTGSTGSSELNNGYLILRGQNDITGIPYIALFSNNPLDPSGLYVLLNGLSNDINPIDGPAITQIIPGGETATIIGFESLTGWTYGTVTFYTPAQFLSGINVSGETTVDYLHFNTNLSSGDTLGDLYYDSITQGLSFKYSDNKILNIGEEILAPLCRNLSGEIIPKGYPVYIAGSDGEYSLIELADYVTYNASRILGITTEDVFDGEVGRVTRFGVINNINLTGFPDGVTVYLIHKKLSVDKPIYGNYFCIIGNVITSGIN